MRRTDATTGAEARHRPGHGGRGGAPARWGSGARVDTRPQRDGLWGRTGRRRAGSSDQGGDDGRGSR